MKFYGIVFAVLLIFTALPAAGCESPPPVTDYASFIENLEYAGATVNVTDANEDAKPFAGYYVDRYRSLLNGDFRGATIDPAFLEESSKHLRQIEEQIETMGFKSTQLSVNGEKVSINEYKDAATADIDAGYVDYLGLELTIPTSSGPFKVQTLSSMPGPVHFFKKGRIVVIVVEEYTRDQSVKDNRAALLELFRRLLGQEFYQL